MYVVRVKLKNWKNFRTADVSLGDRAFFIGPNGCGKSNFLDIFRFMRDIVKKGGGLEKAVEDRGGTSRIRCLTAREDPEVELEFHFAQSLEPDPKVKYKYTLAFKSETRGNRRTLISKEEVSNGNGNIISRPDKNDENDDWRLTQTHLEQIAVNKEFREVYNFFNDTLYLHIVPQLLRCPDMFFNLNVSKTNDSFGFHFLEKIHDTPGKTRESRLKKIEKALKAAVPQLSGLTIYRDNRGAPHLQATYEHWRPNAGKLEEKEFSDGTIRLIAFLWSILDSNSLLLLEEPELSLNSHIVNHIPSLIHRITSTKKKKQQVLISTHSPELLSDPGIGPEEIFLLKPGKEGTAITATENIENFKWLMNTGTDLSEIALSQTRPKDLEQLSLF
ncbi:MAG: AAA family ATPase [bacterium]|nr:AAA family ATPase [bacterium]